jgi:hypothetical protein
VVVVELLRLWQELRRQELRRQELVGWAAPVLGE